MSDATQLAPAAATTSPFLIEHVVNGEDTETLVNDELVVSSWPSLNQPDDGDQIYVAPVAWGFTPGFLVTDESAARQARTAIARIYIAGLKAGAR
ncbi:Uncharacterised protein [Mycobacteroides abscessus subsp. abscessus]|uniref:hypothetical protein n=1 Tax=Mycobacteroides abscessus TaxID=36809 RepID=UPI00026836C2|nr:hypothetical protein [Mycobacteroides abscessus]EIT89454.1 hypothetical protein MA4S0303_3252 [Mycobacteroides abscessus 4S-0303]EIT91447.1 hypothetical protein MA4S0726RB_2776 [Mycobacteroides abscessus 4S-0726-RB]EIT94996.1 hypothetical protein MA4S0726RA_3186 [Mycobacteroides abscessus 4S-0726-RA]EIV08697.1 hypothetical protein MA4S0206_3270 [Mycobacteroides abscessus 4S-0206]EIV47141.1 hypothetical protein MA4S0116R_3226 [Mycobacteroides abscessus 4S-0116-R]